jgi:hypothetical protein
MGPVTELALLTAWDVAQTSHGRARALALAEAVTELSWDELYDLPIGAVDALLLDLRQTCFGPTLECLTSCPRCAETLDVVIDMAELRSPVADPVRQVDLADGVVVLRALTTRDLEAASDRVALLRRCIVSGDPERPDVLAAVEGCLDELDPQAAPTVELGCPACGHCWPAPFDIAEFVWTEVDQYARRLLHDIHGLASAYGWRESDVLAVSPQRRSFYLQATGA